MAPVTQRADPPNPAATLSSSDTRPGPKTMRVAVANSKAMDGVSQTGSRRSYFSGTRGAAIIGATVSRQTA